MVPIIFTGVFVAVLIALWIRSRKPRLPYPPSPPAHPILGHLKTLPREYDEDAYRTMADKYGGIMHFNILGKSIVILNSEKVANDLLDKRSAIYSDRPPLPFHQMTGLANTLTFLPYGNEFSKTRKMIQEQLTRKKCTLFEDVQLTQRNVLLQNLWTSPADFASHAKQFSSAVVLEMTYGHKIVPGDRFLKNAEVLDKMIADAGGAGLVILDFFPILRHLPAWFPGAWFTQFAQRIRPLVEELKEYGVAVVENNVSSGKAQVSFSSLHLEELDSEKRKSKEELERLKWAAFTLWTGKALYRYVLGPLVEIAFFLLPAGSETTWSAIEAFFLAMVLHPDVQRKAQKELDTVLGHGELPGFEDRDNLPYLNCVVQEVLRWTPVIPLGKLSFLLIHVISSDVITGLLNKVFHIALCKMTSMKGCSFRKAQWHMLTREDVYHKPFTFLPERFLSKPDGFGEPLPSVVFGFGRRICPGRWLAQSEMWIAIASILSVFDIKPIQNNQGEDVLPPPEFHVSLTSHPKPFQCRVLPRSDKAKTVLRQL
ncbi:hypothetical protein NLI96_g4619 [Meripilus lineatus]|uniref:Cytochrome P450 n=1 Tax=Meripilus lineatus TaxID=2056292 RepID=A0AAD5YFI5_9APHY|nr:hypothetical protein NLI96_g4619 [Physisporinus lineatus]